MKTRFTASHLAVALAMAAGSASSAWAHATLQSATPAKDAEVTAPKEITLKFNENLEAAFSNAKVVDSNGKTVGANKAELDSADPSVMKLHVPNLAPGKYTVQFIAVGHDGHRRKGTYSFSVK